MKVSFEELLPHIKNPPARFRLPLRFRLEVELRLRYKDLRGELPNIDPGLAFRWQMLLGYLHQRGVLTSPHPARLPVDPSDPNIYSFYLTHTPIKSDGHPPPYFNRGSSINSEEALAKTVGEFLERYPLLIYRNHGLLRGSPIQLKRGGYQFLDPAILAGFSEKQKKENPYLVFTNETSFKWAAGYSLFDNQPCFLPAQLVFWNYCIFGPEGPEPSLRERNTNGAAGMFSRGEAILAGLCELIQRDGLLIHWLNRLSPPRIDISSTQYGKIPWLREACRRNNLTIEVLDFTSDINVPVAFAIIIDNSGGGPAISMGGSCDVSPEKTVERAIEEALGIRLWIKILQERKEVAHLNQFAPPPSPEYIDNPGGGQRARVLFWAKKENLPLFKSTLLGPFESFESFKKRFPAYNSAQEALQKMLDAFRSRGPEYKVYVYETQHPILEEVGYHSVRVIVPALVPFYLNESHRPLGAQRLKEVPSILGAVSAYPHWNPLMHPFP